MPLREPPIDRSWVASDRALARRFARPLREFLSTEASGGIVILVGALVALIWANSPWRAGYESLWAAELSIGIGGRGLEMDLRHWINDGAMTLFFFVVGLEIKRELVSGYLTTARKAALPAIAALGGMIAPALIYTAFNAGGQALNGWGIPMATDIAFAVGVLALLGKRIPTSIKVFLLSVAIVDDIGAIAVIAAFYSSGIEWQAVAIALALLMLVIVMRNVGIRYTPVYAIVGAAVWLATEQSGIHATIAGVALGLISPARPLTPQEERADAGQAIGAAPSPAEVRALQLHVQEAVPVTERLQHALHPWTSFVIVPLFAFANAGVALSPAALTEAASSRVVMGIVAGLVIGKLVGISLFSWASVRIGAGELPEGSEWTHVIGVAAVAGIGFTVSLFISALAFEAPELMEAAKIGIFAGSLIAAVLGVAILRRIAAKPDSSRATVDEAVQTS